MRVTIQRFGPIITKRDDGTLSICYNPEPKPKTVTVRIVSSPSEPKMVTVPVRIVSPRNPT
jgi:hypothetical protein